MQTLRRTLLIAACALPLAAHAQTIVDLGTAATFAVLGASTAR
jgi:hypothetical protein